MASHMKWSKNINQIWPRITMMAGVDNYGEIYYSLLQANSSEITLELVLTHLVKILDS